MWRRSSCASRVVPASPGRLGFEGNGIAVGYEEQRAAQATRSPMTEHGEAADAELAGDAEAAGAVAGLVHSGGE